MFSLPTLALTVVLSDPMLMHAAGLLCPADPVPEIRLPNEVPRNVRPWKPKPPADVPPVTTLERPK